MCCFVPCLHILSLQVHVLQVLVHPHVSCFSPRLIFSGFCKHFYGAHTLVVCFSLQPGDRPGSHRRGSFSWFVFPVMFFQCRSTRFDTWQHLEGSQTFRLGLLSDVRVSLFLTACSVYENAWSVAFCSGQGRRHEGRMDRVHRKTDSAGAEVLPRPGPGDRLLHYCFHRTLPGLGWAGYLRGLLVVSHEDRFDISAQNLLYSESLPSNDEVTPVATGYFSPTLRRSPKRWISNTDVEPPDDRKQP